MQGFGHAHVLPEDDPDFEHYQPAFRRHFDHTERSCSPDEPPSGPLILIEAERIDYTEHRLQREGLAPRQYWTRPGR
ncbi:hypothetical protein ACWGKW_42840 [Streptomyces sp. NPDC054766]